MRIALLADLDRRNAATIEDSIEGFARHSKYPVTVSRFSGSTGLDLSQFDLLIIHYNLIAYPYAGDGFLSSEFRVRISRFPGKKIAWIQDEYRNILERNRFLNSLGINHVLTLANDEVARRIYNPKFVKLSTSRVFAGYLPDYFEELIKRRIGWENRIIDVGYRARKLPSWMGKLGREKQEIGELVLNSAVFRDSKLSISSDEDERLYGEKWKKFLLQTKVALGTESGCSTLDFDGRLSADWVNKSERGLCDRFHPETHEYSMISPRVFEYAAAGNIMALYPGEYSGVIEPWSHYFPLKPDGSNLESLHEFMNDSAAVNSMIERVDRDILSPQKYGYPQLAKHIDQVCEDLRSDTAITGKDQLSGESNLKPLPQNAGEESNLEYITSFYELFATRLATSEWVPFRKQAVDINRYVRKLLSAASVSMKWRRTVRLGPPSIRDVISAAEKLNLKISVLRREILELHHEVTCAVNAQVEIEVHESGKSIWLQWKTSPETESQAFLRHFPRMTFEALPLARGVYSSRAEFAESGLPQKYESLSGLHRINPLVVRTLFWDLSKLRRS